MIPRETKDIIKIKKSLFDSDHKIITIAGLSKNAGKTSFLNYLIKQYTQPENLAVTTTGHDGEDTDFLTGLKKPRIKLQKGNYFTTLPSVLDNHPGSVRIIKKLSLSVLSEPLYLAQAVQAIETEIYGAAHMEQQIALCHEIQSEHIHYIMIDGSLDRKSIALSSEIDTILIVASPVAGNIKDLSANLNRLYSLSKIKAIDLKPEDSSCFYYQINDQLLSTGIHSFFKHENELTAVLKQNPDIFYMPGALTDHVMQRFKDQFFDFKGILVIKHPLHLMCSDYFLDLLLKKELYCLNTFPLSAFALNSYSVDNNHIHSDVLLKTSQDLFNDTPVIDVQSLYRETIS